MRSKFLLGLAVFSLLLAIVVGVFWGRSYVYYDYSFYSNLERSHQLYTLPGVVVFSTWGHLPASDFDSDAESYKLGKMPLKVYRNGELREIAKWDNPPGMLAGFWFERGSFIINYPDGTVYDRRHVHVAFPFWAPVLLFLLPPIAWCLKLWQRYRRAKTGHCIYCNAEMPTPDRCPNCEREFESWVI